MNKSISTFFFILLTSLLGVSNAWGADNSKSDSWNFSTSGNASWTATNEGAYCGKYGNKSNGLIVINKNIANFKAVNFSIHQNVSLTINVNAGTNGGTNKYTVTLVDANGDKVSTYETTVSGKLGNGNGTCAESSVTFTPTEAFAGYKITFVAKGFIASTSYSLTYDNKAGGTVAVTGVTLNKTSTSIAVGSTETLTATVAPSNATNKNVTWTSSNTSVATVDASGKVTAVAAGSATITVKTTDGNKTATCAVTVTAGGGGSGDGDTYTLVTDDSDLSAGDIIVFGYNSGSDTGNKVAGGLDGSYLTSEDATISGNVLISNNAMEFTLGGTSGAWTFTSSSGQLYSSGNKNVNFNNNGTGTWTISISDGDATISNGTSSYGNLQYNSGSPRFTTYTSTQKAIQIYRKEAGTKYDITWNNGGHGTAPTAPTSAASVTLPELEAEGYTHTGWKADQTVKVGGVDKSAETLLENGAKATLTANTTFTAQWEVETYTITLTKSSYDCATDGSITIQYNATAPTSFTPATRTGYIVSNGITATDVFGGYCNGPSGGSRIFNPDGTFAADNITGFITNGKWTNTSKTLVLHPRWEENCSNMVNVSVNVSGEHGTAAVDKTSISTCSCTNGDRLVKITATPETGYVVENITWATTSGTVTATKQDGNSGKTIWSFYFAQDNSGAGTFTVTFVEQKKYHITFINNLHGGSTSTSAECDENVSTSITFPSISDATESTGTTCEEEHFHFVGWVKNGQAVTDANIKKAGSNTVKLTSNETYYAVWAKKVTGTGNTYKILTSSDDITTGDYVIATMSGGYAYPMGNTLSSKQISGTASVDVTNSTTISNPAAQYIWTITKNSSNQVSLYNAAKSSNKYLNIIADDKYGQLAFEGTAKYYTYTKSGSPAKWIFNSVNISGQQIEYYNSAYKSYSSQGENIYLFRREDSYGDYVTTCDDVICESAGAAFSLGGNVTKSTESGDFTNTVTYAKTNTSTQTWTSSNTEVATVNATSGLVHIVGIGETTIRMTQGADISNAPDNVCSVSISYVLTVTSPSIDIVEVTADDKIIIEHDIEGDSKLVFSEERTDVKGNIADDIFFSKYFEAASNMKLFALYNGTKEAIDMSKLRVRGTTGDCRGTRKSQQAWSTKKGDRCYVELKDVSKLKEDYPDLMLPPFTEIIFWSNQGNSSGLTDCIEMKINEKTYGYAEMKTGSVPNWYCLGHQEYYWKDNDESTGLPALDADGNAQFNFNGDDALILERTNDNGSTWTAIDLFGASIVDAPTGTTNGKVQQVDGSYNINGSNQVLNDNPGGYYWNETGWTFPLSTNRYYLVRKVETKSGANAVAKNTSTFATLGEEWTGKPVGGYYAEQCYSGKMFSEVGQYDFSNYYTHFEEVDLGEDKFQDLGDGTMAITVPDLDSYSCKYVRIEVKSSDGKTLKAKLDYKVPIIVTASGTETNNPIFTKFDDCSTCDVVILQNATLAPNASGKNTIRDLEVYRGAKLNVPSTQTLTVNNLIMRSKGDVTPQADIQGTLNRKDTKLYFDKRVDENQWYWIALPYDCNMADVTFRNGEKPTYGVGKDWVLKTYNGVKRANTQAGGCWEVVPENSTLKAGVGYILGITPKAGHDFVEIRFPMTAAQWDKNRATVTVPVTPTASEGITPNHVGWNLVGNPYLTNYAPGYVGMDNADNTHNLIPLGLLQENAENEYERVGSTRYVVIPQNGGYSEYKQVAIGDQELPTFMSYFIQIDGTEGGSYAVDFKYANSRNAAPARRAPEEYMEEPEDNHPVWVPVTLANVKGEKDETTFLISNQFTDKYDMMDDLIKWRGDYYQYPSVTTKPVLASRNSETELAFNALPDNSAWNGIPLNYFATNAGMYTVELSDKYGLDEVAEAVLYDATTKVRHDLKAEPYTFSSDRTDNTDRFTLYIRVERKKAPEVATDLGNLTADDKPQKVLVNGNVYILRGGKVFDITGKQVR